MAYRYEYELTDPVRKWLEARGWVLHVEQFGADIVCMKDGKLLVVELKLTFSGHLMQQCHDRARWADFVFAATPIEPRGISVARSWGIGVLIVKESGSVRQKLLARPQPWSWHKMRNYRIKKLTGKEPAALDALAGLPSGGGKWKDTLTQRRLSGD